MKNNDVIFAEILKNILNRDPDWMLHNSRTNNNKGLPIESSIIKVIVLPIKSNFDHLKRFPDREFQPKFVDGY